MRKLSGCMAIAFVICFAGGTARAETAATQPKATTKATQDRLTAEEIRKLVDAGKFRDVLKAVSRVVNLTGPAAADYDHHEMMMVKAECQMQIWEMKGMQETLTTELKDAKKADNEMDAAEASAMMSLVEKSPGLSYMPRTTAIHKPIPLLDRTQRKAAYDALFADEFTLFQKAAKQAILSPTLPATMAAAKVAAGLRDIELVATGSHEQSEKVMGDLAEHALKLVNTMLDDMSSRTDQISTEANKLITEQTQPRYGRNNNNNYPETRTHRRGLLGSDAQVLQEVIRQCAPMPEGMQELAKALGSHVDAFHVTGMRAENLSHQANMILHDDYTTVVQ